MKRANEPLFATACTPKGTRRLRFGHITYTLVWPQWWSLRTWVSIKIIKIKIFFLFDFHRCSHGPSKIRRHFRNKSCSILKLSKNVFYKKCGPKLIFFNEFFFRKIRTFFDTEKWFCNLKKGGFIQRLLNINLGPHFL